MPAFLFAPLLVFRYVVLAAGFVLLPAAIASAASDSPKVLKGRVVGVQDGDTIDVLIEGRARRIRLMGIDAPEKAQDFGQRSKQHLSEQTYNKQIVALCGEYDSRTKREVCKVLVDNRDVNHAQVQAGMAWHYRQYQHVQAPEDRVKYATAHNNAKSKRAGLWIDPSPTAPWDYRKKMREGSARQGAEPFEGVTDAADLARRIVHALAR